MKQVDCIVKKLGYGYLKAYFKFSKSLENAEETLKSVEETNKKHTIYKQKYVCSNKKKCKHHKHVFLTQFIDKYHNYTKSIKQIELKIRNTYYTSHNNIKKYISEFKNINISR